MDNYYISLFDKETRRLSNRVPLKDVIYNQNEIKFEWGKFGKEHNCSKIVYQLDKYTNNILNIYYGVQEASRKTHIVDSSIYAVIYGERKTAGGYKWKYGD